MRRTAIRTVLATAAAIPLCLAIAAPATAAPGDVILSATSIGDTVTATITNNSGEYIDCDYAGYVQPYDPAALGGYGSYLFTNSPQVDIGASQSWTYDYQPVGEEVFIEWGCQTAWSDESESWGSLPNVIYPALDEPTVGPTVVTIGDGQAPEPSDETCFGSVCLPAGALGF